MLTAVIASALLPAAPAAAARCADAGTAPTARTLDGARAATLCLLNAERAQRGLPRLRENSRLRVAARRHSGDMNDRSYFAHVTPGGLDVVDRVRATGYLSSRGAWTVGENIAWGSSYLASPRSIVAGWMRSPTHRANILNGRFRHVGIGITTGTPRRNTRGATYTTNFGARG